jgi:AmpD protein
MPVLDGSARAPRVRGWREGWWREARAIASPNFGPRPAGTAVTLAVVHAISLPPGEYGGPQIEQLFTNRLDWDAHPYFQQIRGAEVSAHFVVRRTGELLQFVSCHQRAWHAGVSSWNGVPNCNDYSIGIELEGLEDQTFEHAQYERLAQLLTSASRRYPLRHVAGHEHVAPGRKHDPGASFDWQCLAQALQPAGLQVVLPRSA